jgi:hypothetical protein
MHPAGRTGTYREVLIKMGATRIVCEACGFCKEVPSHESDDYELWYATDFKGRRLWARDRGHLDFLISWVSGHRSKAALGVADRALVEAFPRWMLLAKNRAGILKCLKELSDTDAKKTVRRAGASRSTHKIR